MIDNLKKLIVYETILLIAFLILGMISLDTNLMPFYLLSCLCILVILFLLFRTILITLNIIENELENEQKQEVIVEVVKKDYRN